MFGFFRRLVKAEGTSASILIIEDSNAERLSLQRALEKDKYLVFTAASGEEGLRLAYQHKIDLIILDYILPGMNGLEVCKLLKQDNRSINIPVLFLTVIEGREILEFYSAGAEFYLHKPVTSRELLIQIRSLLSRNKG